MARLYFHGDLLMLPLLAVVSAAQSQIPPAAVSPKPVASPSAPSMHALIESLQPGELQQVIPLLKNNFINPAALNDIELNRATLEGLMTRLGHGVMLLPNRAAAGTESVSPFYSEVLGGHIGYLRAGSLTVPNLQALDTALKNFAGQKVDALVLDLRASPPTNDFATVAEFAKRFSPKGKTLFVLRKPTTRQERTFASERDPTFQGMVVALTDGDTAGAAEVLAGVLRLYARAMIIGQATAGRAVEYSDLPLPSGKILRVAVSEVLVPEMRPLFPEGLSPDLSVEMSSLEKREVFQQSMTKGMSRFVFESERPHLNEAALLAGTNPELEAIQAAQRAGRGATKETLRDPVVQRAVDLVTSVAIYQKR